MPPPNHKMRPSALHRRETVLQQNGGIVLPSGLVLHRRGAAQKYDRGAALLYKTVLHRRRVT